MIDKLAICNGALRLLRETQLTQAELTNNSREPARVFNSIWDDGGVRATLEFGQWKFAKRSVMLEASPSIDPEFGFAFAFDKPTDWVRTIGTWSDEAMTAPLRNIRDEAGYWYANLDTFYAAYVSDDAAFGGDYSLWPQTFVRFVQAHFAAEMAGPMTDAGKELVQIRKMRLSEALSNDAMADPSRDLPPGSWVTARSGWFRSRENG